MTVKKGGVKGVTVENWLVQDPVMVPWTRVNMVDGSSRPTTGEDWILSVNAVMLAPHVPDEIHDLFEYAKGAMGYGYFYYPLFTLVAQQLLRVADIAVDVLFDKLAVVPKPKSLDRRIVILRERWLIDDEQYFLFDMLREMRNRATHDPTRTILMPPHAIEDIHWIAEMISGLPWPIQH